MQDGFWSCILSRSLRSQSLFIVRLRDWNFDQSSHKMMHDITRLTLPFSDECPTKFYSCQFLKIISIRKWCVWHVKLFVEQLSEQIGNWMVKKEIGNQRLNCGMWLYPFCSEIWYTLNITRKQTLSLFLFRRGSSTSPKVCTLQSTWNSTILCTFNLIHPSTRFPEVSLDYIHSFKWSFYQRPINRLVLYFAN